MGVVKYKEQQRDKERGTNEKGLDHRTAFPLSAPSQGVCLNAAKVASSSLAVQTASPDPEYPGSQTNGTIPPVVVDVPVPPLLLLLATSIDGQVGSSAAQTFCGNG